jgi:hypothetical protein
MQAKRIHARELEMHMKSKKQLYACLTLEGKVHLQLNFNSPNLPAALWECSVTFMQQIMSGKKKVRVWLLTYVLVLSQQRHQHREGASLRRALLLQVYHIAMADARFRMYFPDYEHEKPINRTYLFNVSAFSSSLCDHSF